jgi:hypothetical protein
MKLTQLLSALLITAGMAGPAAANWFDNTLAAGENHKKLVGSTPTPTPDDLRAIGDSALGVGKAYHFDEKSGHWHEVRPQDGSTGASPPVAPTSVAPRVRADRQSSAGPAN